MKKHSLHFLWVGLLVIASASDIQGQISRFNRKIRSERYDSAISFANRELNKLKSTNNNYKLLKKSIPFYIGLGGVYRSMGNYREAERVYNEGYNLSIQKQMLKSKSKLGRYDLDIMDALADMQIELGNYKNAGELLEKSIKERRENMSKTNLQRYRPYLFYAKYLIAIGKPNEAYGYLRDYILYIKNTYHTSYEDLDRFAEAYETLARLELSRGNLEEASRLAEKNFKYQNHRWVRQRAGKNNLNRIESCNILSRCSMFSETFPQAIDWSNQAFSIYNAAIGNPTIYKVPILVSRAEIFMNMGSFDSAFLLFKEANKIQIDFANNNFGKLSEYEKENFVFALKQNTSLFFNYAIQALNRDVSFKNDLLLEAYQVQINTKAKLLDESSRLINLINKSDDQDLKTLFSELVKEKNEYAHLITTGIREQDKTKISALERKIESLDKTLNGIIDAKFGSIGRQIASSSAIANKLGDEEASIEIIRVGKYSPVSGSKVKVISNSNPYYLLLGITNDQSIPNYNLIEDGFYLEDRAFKYYSNAIRSQVNDTLSFNYYFKPIETITKKRNIYVSSDGIFNVINLSVLSDNKNFVQDNHLIVNVTNTKSIALDRTVPAYSTATLYGRPQFSYDLLSPIKDDYKPDTIANRAIVDFTAPINDLPGTELEILEISRLLNLKNITTNLKLHNDASEFSLKNDKSTDILHIATHGFFVNEANSSTNPMMRSGLLFSGVKRSNLNENEDGILNAYEAALLNLENTKLVVLSACETGLGDIKNGEGIYGLQRAFEAAGVRNILMSLWKVDDEATMVLMRTFYEDLLLSNSPILSLRVAQKKLRTMYNHPYYWGAFKVIGN